MKRQAATQALEQLATDCERDLPEVAVVLHALCGALLTHTETGLAQLAAIWAADQRGQMREARLRWQ